MIENLIVWLKTPLGEEIFFLFLLPLIASVLVLWGLSKLFKFKRNSFLTALLIGFLTTWLNFQIRFINILFSLSDSQKPLINVIAMILSNILLIVLIVMMYRANWWKTILTWLGVYYGKLLFTSMVFLLLFFTVPTLRESDSAPTMKPGISDFKLPYADEVGKEIGENHFVVYRSLIKKPEGIRTVNIASSVAFNNRVENVRMNMRCFSDKSIFIESMEDEENMYKFTSLPQSNLDFKIINKGTASFSCAEVCSKDKTIFHPENLGKEEGYVEKVDVAKMNTGEFTGTRVLFVEKRKPIDIGINLPIYGEDSATITCELSITTDNLSENIKKSFKIEYTAKDTECGEYTKLGNYAPGEVIVEFTQEVSKEQIESLLSSYGLSSDKIEFPEMFDFRIDFEGDERGFLDFLEEYEFIKLGNPNVFIARSFKDISCDKAKEIFYSYPKISIDYVYCFKSVKGIVEVPEGEEDKWICELKKNGIIMDVNLNKIGSIAN